MAVTVAIGCGAGGRSAPPPGLSIANGTTLPVTLLVNGTFAPGVERDPIPATDLPALSWNIKARSPSGRVLAAMTVHPGDVAYGAGDAMGDGARGHVLRAARDRVRPADAGTCAGTFAPGDCAP